MSDDGVNWKAVGLRTNPVRQTGAVVGKDFSSTVESVPLRFVKLTAKNVGTCPAWHPGAGDKAWLFVDEVIVE